MSHSSCSAAVRGGRKSEAQSWRLDAYSLEKTYGSLGQKVRAAFWGAGKAVPSTALHRASAQNLITPQPSSSIHPQTSEYCSWSGNLRPLASQ